MTLNAGTRLGQHEIVAPIGKGGMGEVYRARDTKLGRDVAIKILPDEFSQDKGRLDRFEREARLLAQLNHPNIATLHGLEESEKRQFLVMELVEGETLAARIARGPIPMDEAIRLFTQIARGLEAAHNKGVIHRDLKPANVMITPEGNVKLLDFGLAKAFASDDAGGVDSSASPTLTKGTALGVIMGTAAYTSPEQARGTAADKRADVWAFLNEGQVVEDATFQEIEIFLRPDRSLAPGTSLELVGRHLHGELHVALVGDAFVDPIEHSGGNAPLSFGLVQLEPGDFAAMSGDELQARLERRHRGGVAESEGTRPRVFIVNDFEAHVGRYHAEERRTIGEIRHEQCADAVFFLG